MLLKTKSTSVIINFRQLLLYICIFIGFWYLIFILVFLLLPKREKEILIQNPQTGLGLGQCHWVRGPFNTNTGVKWGYSSSTPFQFVAGEGDSWAAIEPVKGEFHFNQIHSEVNNAKSRGKKVMLQIQVADKQNKEHNVPKWAINEGVETYISSSCGDLSYSRNKSDWVWDDGTKNSVKPVWNNPQYVDQSEAVLLKSDGTTTTNPNEASKVRFSTKIAAVWDPRFRDYYGKALVALRNEFQNDISNGTITAIAMMSGGESGECILGAKCAAWDSSCNPDVLNASCPAVLSLAKFVQAQHYPNLTVEQVASNVIAKKSNCVSSNVVPDTKVQLCTEANQANCPTEYGSYCFVFDDYFIQAEKSLIQQYVTIFNPTPVVWQQGSGLSGTGRVNKIIESWMNTNFKANIWMKFNGWGPRDTKMWSRNFSQYSQIGARGYEPDHPNSFSKLKYWKGKEEEGKLAIINAIKNGIVGDKSSYLCMQSNFFVDPPVDIGNGLLSNQYYFNPQDQSSDCVSSEINVAQYGVGFCPGYLNNVMQANVPVIPNETARPTITTVPTSSPTTRPTATPSPTSTANPTNTPVPTSPPTNVPNPTATVAPTATPGTGGITFSCTGNSFSNATLCSNDDNNLTINTPKVLVANCSQDRKCEYVCNSGYTFNNGTCTLATTTTYNCVGTIPSHSQACPGYHDGLTMDMSVLLLDSCSGNVTCVYTCNSGYHRVNQQCVANTNPTSTAIPTSTPTPTPTPNNQSQTTYACYDRCQYDSQCSNSLLCRSVDGTNRCINIECPKESDCSCNPTTPQQPGLPQAGYMPASLRIILLLSVLGLVGTAAFTFKRKRL